MKEHKIGESFQYNGKEYIVEKALNGTSCYGCCFYYSKQSYVRKKCNDTNMICEDYSRLDGENVIFKVK